MLNFSRLLSLKNIRLGFKGLPETNVTAGNPYVRGRLSTVDLLVLTSLDQLLFYKISYFNEEVMVLSLPQQFVFRGYSIVGVLTCAEEKRFSTLPTGLTSLTHGSLIAQQALLPMLPARPSSRATSTPGRP
jgi:hypothetical protein